LKAISLFFFLFLVGVERQSLASSSFFLSVSIGIHSFPFRFFFTLFVGVERCLSLSSSLFLSVLFLFPRNILRTI